MPTTSVGIHVLATFRKRLPGRAMEPNLLGTITIVYVKHLYVCYCLAGA